MKNQTALEFLIKEFSEILGPLDTKPMQDLLIMDAIKKAKEMEKEQIQDAYEMGYENAWDDAEYYDEPIYGNSQDYYKQTYIGNE